MYQIVEWRCESLAKDICTLPNYLSSYFFITQISDIPTSSRSDMFYTFSMLVLSDDCVSKYDLDSTHVVTFIAVSSRSKLLKCQAITKHSDHELQQLVEYRGRMIDRVFFLLSRVLVDCLSRLSDVPAVLTSGELCSC
jgi:hypothetical protein